MSGTLIVGYDDTPAARQALDFALELAALAGDRVVVAYAAKPPGRPGEEYRALAEATRELGEQAVAEATRRATEAGVAVEARVEPLGPVDLLLGLADELDARLIVVGTYGESPLRGAVVGSTPHKLLHLSERPVLVVPAPHGRAP